MEVGLLFGSGLKFPEMLDAARTAEASGLDALFTSELAVRDAFTPLGAFAAATKRVKLGTGIVSIFTRSPVTTAMTAATLDEMSGGRMVLGLGTSPPFYIKGWHSTPFERPVTRMKEFVQIVKLVVAGERLNFEGKVFRSKGFQLAFQAPRKDLPVLVAGVGPQMIEAAGAVADGVLLPPLLCPEYLEFARKHLEIGAQKAGRKEVPKLTAMPIISIAADKKTAIKQARPNVTFYSIVYYYKWVIEAGGFGHLHEAIREANKTKGMMAAEKLVPDELVDKVAICGTPEECWEKLQDYGKLGLDLSICYPPMLGNAKAGTKAILEMARQFRG